MPICLDINQDGQDRDELATRQLRLRLAGVPPLTSGTADALTVVELLITTSSGKIWDRECWEIARTIARHSGVSGSSHPHAGRRATLEPDTALLVALGYAHSGATTRELAGIYDLSHGTIAATLHRVEHAIAAAQLAGSTIGTSRRQMPTLVDLDQWVQRMLIAHVAALVAHLYRDPGVLDMSDVRLRTEGIEDWLLSADQYHEYDTWFCARPTPFPFAGGPIVLRPSASPVRRGRPRVNAILTPEKPPTTPSRRPRRPRQSKKRDRILAIIREIRDEARLRDAKEREQARKLFEEGHATAEVARRLGCSVSRAARHIDPSSPAPALRYLPAEVETLQDFAISAFYYRATVKDLAEAIGVPPSTVWEVYLKGTRWKRIRLRPRKRPRRVTPARA